MKNNGVIAICIILLALFFQTASAQESSIKFQFSVLDEKGKFVSELKPSDIQVLHNKKPLAINSLESKAESPLEIVIMIDVSASQERTLPFAKTFAGKMIDEIFIDGKDKVAIVKFSGEVLLVQDLTENSVKAKEGLKSIEFEPPTGFIGSGVVGSPLPPNSKQLMKGSTSIWDSLETVVTAFSKTKNPGFRQMIILISDGINTFGDSKLKEVVYSSVKNQVPIYAVGLGDKIYDGVDKNTLRKLTEQTGGVLILPDEKGKDVAKQIELLINGLRSIYEATLTFNQVKSQNPLQELTIEIINPELRKRKLQIIQPKGFVLSEK